MFLGQLGLTFSPFGSAKTRNESKATENTAIPNFSLISGNPYGSLGIADCWPYTRGIPLKDD